jgi:uncharacterized protein (DUF302 family)
METKIGTTVRLKTNLTTAIVQVAEALKSEGFGVLTEIDVKETMMKKLGLEYEPFKILGACNPSLAHRALSIAPEISLLLPCNVVVRQLSDDETEISLIDPLIMMEAVGKPELGDVAREARARLDRVAAALQAS